jgi:hypothetical protein
MVGSLRPWRSGPWSGPRRSARKRDEPAGVGLGHRSAMHAQHDRVLGALGNLEVLARADARYPPPRPAAADPAQRLAVRGAPASGASSQGDPYVMNRSQLLAQGVVAGRPDRSTTGQRTPRPSITVADGAASRSSKARAASATWATSGVGTACAAKGAGIRSPTRTGAGGPADGPRRPRRRPAPRRRGSMPQHGPSPFTAGR